MMYHEKAEHYDRIYQEKDYAGEAGELHELLVGEGVEDGSRVLEVACGTGNFTALLSAYFAMTGSDVSPEMLALAKQKLPDVPLVLADMRDFTVPEKFDAVLCLFSSIGYVLSEEDLASTCRSFARALRPDGCLIVEPWIFPSDWRNGMAHMGTYDGDEVKLCRANVSKQEGKNAVLDFHWLAAWTEGDVEHWTERHELRLWTDDEMRQAFSEAGFAVKFIEEGRGRYVCRLRTG
jgi:dTDP-3-amino-3,4,6-trideoxy-alpha-D-glucopyranose N,N-dimethyltransferase